ncbi:tetratricopeptide repeat protein [Leptospira kanakyensis]|uniref:tetratricopeptide repeat protein n=1 Tax=Leptospira kanakyensis TaxID=2484968 RepID=UPI00223C9275|nr:tetratricopeptide repeat protein [Leptospira kanakyensis]MCW7482242.1 tetratricopeptide repeat protein [Leptospira kanakyensis]
METVYNEPTMKVDGQKALTILDKAREEKKKSSNERALSLFQEYLSMVDPSFTHGVWFSMAEIYFETNRLPNALTHCEKALEIMKEFTPALELKVKIHKRLGNENLALQDKQKLDELERIEKAKWDDPNHYYHYK